MESIQELIPFAKEMLSQKPSRGLLKVYLVGSLFAVLGTVVGLVETMCHPFLSSQPVDAEMLLMIQLLLKSAGGSCRWSSVKKIHDHQWVSKGWTAA
uniref:G0/G1 switch 2 n=1 Tax=Amphiprion percula TaxID=161767 RepID=A0A3P8UER1_AMPPE